MMKKKNQWEWCVKVENILEYGFTAYFYDKKTRTSLKSFFRDEDLKLIIKGLPEKEFKGKIVKITVKILDGT